MSLFSTPAPAPGTPGVLSFGAPTPGAATPAPAPFGFGAPTPAPSPALGGFGGHAAATTPSFGSFGNPGSAPSTGLFGATPAPSSAFGSSFRTPAPAPAPGLGGGSLFGGSTQVAAPAPFGAPATVSFGTSAVAGFGAPAPGVAGAVGAQQGVAPETRYSDLPDGFKKGIDALWSEVKRQRGLANEVGKTDSSMGLVLQGEMRELRKNLLDLGNMQQAQKLASDELKGDVRKGGGQAEVYGTFLLQQMVTPSGLRTVEELPSQFMWETLARFEKRLREYIQEIETIRQQLQAQDLQDGGGMGGMGEALASPAYGQRERVTPERLGLIIRDQMKTFHHVAGHVASTHEKVEALRVRHKATYGDDPFDRAERREREAQRRLEKKMRAQAPPPPNPQPGLSLLVQQQQPVPAAPAPGLAPSAFGGLFGSSAAAPAGATPAPGGSLFGASPSTAFAPAPAPGFGGLFGTPAPAPGPAVGGLFGVAAPVPVPAPATFGAAPAAGGGLSFGTAGKPAAAGGFGFGSGAAGATPASAPQVHFGAAPAPAATTNVFGTSSTSSGTSTHKKKSKGRNKR